MVKSKIYIGILLILILVAGCTQKNPHVRMKTDLGDIIIELFPDQAPLTVSNFLKYVEQDRFQGAHFYRVVRLDNQPDNEIKIEVIQGGLGFAENEQRLSPIKHETTKMTGILHKEGTISMARSKPGTASSEFFICLNDQPELDFGGKRNPDGQGFAAFGKVISSMEVARKIQMQPDKNQMLINTIKISEISLVE